MADSRATINDLKQKVAQFVDERDWGQFHTPKNLSMSIAIEAAELMEKFQWTTDQTQETEMVKSEQVAYELVDILSYILSFAHRNNIDLSVTLTKKLAITAQKYPIDEVKSSVEKYIQAHQRGD